MSLLNQRLDKLKSLVVNAIYITEPDYAGEVFESINGTGITLKLSELVKNYIFRSTSIKSIETLWQEIESNCNNKPNLIESMIKYDWQNQHDEADDFEIFRSIKKNIENVDEYFKHIHRLSKIFSFYLNPNTETFKNLKIIDNRNDKNHIIKLASTLRVLNVKQFLRLIITLDSLRDYIEIGEYISLLRNIQNFQVRAKIAGIATNEIDRIYSKYGKTLYKIKTNIKESKQTSKETTTEIRRILFYDLPSELQKQSGDEIFQAGFINLSRTKAAGQPFFKYVLGAIENNLQKNELHIDTKDNHITLEEIYPQHPAVEWSHTDLDSDDIYKIGNATILKSEDNGAGSNKAVKHKYSIYENSNLRLNKDLIGIIHENDMNWSKATILHRSQELSKSALQIWKIKINS